jgi:hypothetical protein
MGLRSRGWQGPHGGGGSKQRKVRVQTEAKVRVQGPAGWPVAGRG